MSSIKNINQNVTNKYSKNFDLIFGEENKCDTGTYIVDKKFGKLIKIDSNIPKSVKDHMEYLTTNVGSVPPVSIIKKEI